MRYLSLLTLLIGLGPAAAGQTSSGVPRLASGHPDLEGYWTNATLTPFERPAEFTGKEFLTEVEASAFEKRMRERNDRDRRGSTAQADVNQAYNEAWFDRGTTLFPSRRTSIVVDPTDGRVPPLTPEAQLAAAARDEVQGRPPQGPEDLGTTTRCIVWPTAGPPMIPGPYNNNYQIVQTTGSVAINVEMIHDMRVIPMDGRPHLSRNIRLWMGDSRGRWEGDTLVVDTTNFTDKTHFRGSDENLHLIERLTRTGPNTLVYRFTVDDPSAFTARWTGEIVMTKMSGPIYEYACHEGNYSMTNILRGARYAESAEKKR
ncbi:MAG TPA: hypothetical protein VKU01_30995 [Bryobacteraceae bacterium]|nr:hypothetical protein [Bryobacteraceae bacterium]